MLLRSDAKLRHHCAQGNATQLSEFGNDFEAFGVLVVALFEERKKPFSLGVGKRSGLAFCTKSMVLTGLFWRKQSLQAQQFNADIFFCGKSQNSDTLPTVKPAAANWARFTASIRVLLL